MDVKKLPKSPILHVSALCDLRVTKKIFEKFQKIGIFPQTGTSEEKTWHFEVLLLFLSLDMAPTWAVPGLFDSCQHSFCVFHAEL